MDASLAHVLGRETEAQGRGHTWPKSERESVLAIKVSGCLGAQAHKLLGQPRAKISCALFNFSFPGLTMTYIQGWVSAFKGTRYAKEGDLGEGRDCLQLHPDSIHQNTTPGRLGSWKGTDKVTW